MKTTKKRFDCVAMKRKGAAAVYAATRGMSHDDELAYWHKLEASLLRAHPPTLGCKRKETERHSSSAVPPREG